MPSICGLDPDGWQETCDPGMGISGCGGGACMASGTMPLSDRPLGHQQLLIPAPRGPRGGRPLQGPSPGLERRVKLSESGSHGALGPRRLHLRTGLAGAEGQPHHRGLRG